MKSEDLANLVQLAGVTVAVVALVVGALDRRNAKRIAEEDRRHTERVAEEDRRAATRQAWLMFELESALRLAENQRRGGSSDPEEASRLGTEAGVLVGLLGKERVPHLAKELNPETEEELRTYMARDDTPEWKRRAVEAHLAAVAIAEELRGESRP